MVDAIHVAALAYPGLKLPGTGDLAQLTRALAAGQEAADLPVQVRQSLQQPQELHLGYI